MFIKIWERPYDYSEYEENSFPHIVNLTQIVSVTYAHYGSGYPENFKFYFVFMAGMDRGLAIDQIDYNRLLDAISKFKVNYIDNEHETYLRLKSKFEPNM